MAEDDVNTESVSIQEIRDLERPVGNSELRHMAILQNGFGGSKVYSLKSVPTPLLDKNEVKIRVKACSVSFQDLMIRQGAVEGIPRTPFTPGFECSGDILEVGDNVAGFEVGDRVFALTHYLAWAEVVQTPACYVFKMPEKMSYEEGAAFPLSYALAYLMLFKVCNVKNGSKIFAHSLGGSVGLAISQLCKSVGEVILLGTASTHKHEKVKDMAAVVFDLTADYVFDVRQMYPEGLDAVFDCRYGEDYNKGFGMLGPLGKYVLYGSTCLVSGETKSLLSFAKSWWHVDKVNPTKFMEENLSLSGINFRRLFFAYSVDQGERPIELLRSIMGHLIDLYNKHQIKPLIDSIWAFDEVGEAMHKLHTRRNIGKILLDPSREKLIVETSALNNPNQTGVNADNVVTGTVIGNVVIDND